MPPKWYLVNNKQERIPLKPLTTWIGRERPTVVDVQCLLVIASRRHAVITHTNDDILFIEDNKSANGTFVNGVQLGMGERRKLRVDDEIGIGSTKANAIASGTSLDCIFVVQYDNSGEGTGSRIVENSFNVKCGTSRELLFDIASTFIVDFEDEQNATISYEPVHVALQIEHQIRNDSEIHKTVYDIKALADFVEVVPPEGKETIITVDSDDEDDLFMLSQCFDGPNKSNCSETAFSNADDDDADDGNDFPSPTDDNLLQDNNDIFSALDDSIFDNIDVLSAKDSSSHYVKLEPFDKKYNKIKTDSGNSSSSSGSSAKKLRKISENPNVKRKSPRKRPDVAAISERKRKCEAVFKVPAVKPKVSKTCHDIAITLKPDKCIELATHNGSTTSKADNDRRCASTSSTDIVAKIIDAQKSKQEKLRALTIIPAHHVKPVRGKRSNKDSESKSDCSSSKLTESTSAPNLPQVILDMLGWNPVWFKLHEEGKVTNILPLTRPMQNAFDNSREYRDTVLPLMTHELWHAVYADWSSAGNNALQFKAKIQYTSANSVYNTISCEYVINHVARDRGHFVQERDLTIVSIPLVSADRRQYVQVIGFVQNVFKVAIAPRNPKSDMRIRFEMYTKPCHGQIATQQIVFGTVVSKLSSSLRFFAAVHYLSESPLKDMILNPKRIKHSFKAVTAAAKTNLNESQLTAINEAAHVCLSKKPGIYLIEGPPGTGKSTVIVNIIKEILARSEHFERILLLAPSNGAIDHLCCKLQQIIKDGENKKSLKMVRIGARKSIHPDVLPLFVDEYAHRAILQRVLGSSPALSDEYRALDEKLVELRAERDREVLNPVKRPVLRKKIDNLKQECWNFPRKVLKGAFTGRMAAHKSLVVNNCQVICTTLSSCAHLASVGDLKLNHKLTCCIVDEATQSVEQETLIPLMLGIKKLVLVGDPQQLTAVTASLAARELGYGNSLFSRIASSWTSDSKSKLRPQLLDTQYRMHSDIAKYPSKAFYSSRLKDGFRPPCPPALQGFKPYLVLRQCHDDPYMMPSQEYANQPEVNLITDLVRAVADAVDAIAGPGNPEGRVPLTIGVITPYAKQKDRLHSGIESVKNFSKNVVVSCHTVDGVQGQEKDVVIISCVRLDGNAFIENVNRLNVALTRAKHVLYVVASESLFKSCVSLAALEQDAKRRKKDVDVYSSTDLRKLIFKAKVDPRRKK